MQSEAFVGVFPIHQFVCTRHRSPLCLKYALILLDDDVIDPLSLERFKVLLLFNDHNLQFATSQQPPMLSVTKNCAHLIFF